MLVAVDSATLYAQSLHEALQLLAEAAQQISGTALIRPVIFGEEQDLDVSMSSPYRRACSFYGISFDEDGLKEMPQTARSAVPFVTAFEDLVALNTAYSRAILDVSNHRHIALKTFVSTLALMTNLVDGLSDHTMAVDWDPAQWLSAVLSMLDQVGADKLCTIAN